MALISCPECKKEVSDKAYSCPVCGFPIREHFDELAAKQEEEKELEIERQEKNKKEDRKKEFAIVKSYKIGDKELLLNQNQINSARIYAYFQVLLENGIKYLMKQVGSETFLEIRKMPEREFFFQRLVRNTTEMFRNEAINLSDLILRNAYGYSHNEADDFFPEPANYKLSDESLSVLKKVARERDEKNDEATQEMLWKHHLASEPYTPITAVYADSMAELIVRDIARKVVNGTFEIASSLINEPKIKKIEEKFVTETNKNDFRYTYTIILALSRYISDVCFQYRDNTIALVEDYGYLFKSYKFPLKEVDFDSFMDTLGIEDTLNDDKYAVAYEYINNNPGDMFAYQAMLTLMYLTEDEFGELCRLIDAFGFREDLIELLAEEEWEGVSILEGEKTYCEQYENAVSYLLEWNGKKYESLSQKEEAIIEDRIKKTEEKSYSGKIHDLENTTKWINGLCDDIKLLRRMGEPKTESIKKKYNHILTDYEKIQKETDSATCKTIASLVSPLVNSETDYVSVVQEKNITKTKTEWKKNPLLKGVLSETELPVLQIKGSSDDLYITTRRFYVENRFRDEETKFFSFSVDEIAAVSSGTKETRQIKFDLIDGRHIWILYDKKRLVESLSPFIDKISDYCFNNPEVQQRRIKEFVERTPASQLTDDYLNRQAMIIQKIAEVTGRKPTFSFDINETDERYAAIARAKLGIECILGFFKPLIIDDATIITDKRIYCLGHKYAYEDFMSILEGQVPGLMWTKHFPVAIYKANKKVERFGNLQNENDLILSIENVLVHYGIHQRIDEKNLLCPKCEVLQPVSDYSSKCKCEKCGKNLSGNDFKVIGKWSDIANEEKKESTDTRKYITEKISEIKRFITQKKMPSEDASVSIASKGLIKQESICDNSEKNEVQKEAHTKRQETTSDSGISNGETTNPITQTSEINRTSDKDVAILSLSQIREMPQNSFEEIVEKIASYKTVRDRNDIKAITPIVNGLRDKALQLVDSMPDVTEEDASAKFEKYKKLLEIGEKRAAERIEQIEDKRETARVIGLLTSKISDIIENAQNNGMISEIDKAVSEKNIQRLWGYVLNGSGYAERKLEQYYIELTRKEREREKWGTIREKIKDVLYYSDQGIPFADCLMAYLYLLYERDYVRRHQVMKLDGEMQKKHDSSWDKIEECASLGVCSALSKVGYNYYIKEGGFNHSYIKALECYMRAAEGLLPTGFAGLSLFYEKGIIIDKDLEKAKILSEIASKLDQSKIIDSSDNSKIHSDCFITSALCEWLGKPDDCYELTMFRHYRDGWLLHQADGQSLICEYYRIAPAIVERINAHDKRAEIYEMIRSEYLAPCLTLIENHKNTECKKLYIRMVTELREKFLHD